MSRLLPTALVLCSGLFLATCTEDNAALVTESAPLFKDPLAKKNIKQVKCDAQVVNRTGLTLPKELLGRLSDPVAQTIFGGNDCPTTLKAMIAKLKKTPGECDMNSLRTMLITETGQLAQKTGPFRTVTVIDCGKDGNTQPSILFSTDPGNLGDTFLEVIGRDQSAGVFNYYDMTNQKINYFGHSQMFVTQPPASTGFNAPRRCGGCHTGGGLVMKELAAPWLHWEGDTTSPGSQQTIDKAKEVLGRKSDGIELESIVRNANDFWNESRVGVLKDNTKPMPSAFDSIAGNIQLNPTQKLLEPLFCATEVNIDSANSSGKPAKQAGGASFGPLGGPIVPSELGFGSINFDAKKYDKVIKQLGQSVAGIPDAKDTHFALTFISQGAADFDYLNKLKAGGILDDEFVKDVLAVDFTRAISTDRCELLLLVPNIDKPADRTIANIKIRLIDELKKRDPRSEQQQELLSNLLLDGGHQDKVQAFEKACQDRIQAEEEAMIKDYVTAIEAGRDQHAENRAVFEFASTLARLPGITPFSTRLHPQTCKITNAFVPTTEAVNRDEACAGRCSVFEDGAKCQCDEECLKRKDCCPGAIGFEAECLIPVCNPDICQTDNKPKSKKGCVSASLKESQKTDQTCVEKICAQDAFCCQSSFDGSCVAAVESVCKFKCPSTDPDPDPQPRGRRLKDDCLKICKKTNPCGKGCIKGTCSKEKLVETQTCDKDGNLPPESKFNKPTGPVPFPPPILPQPVIEPAILPQ